MTEVTQFHSGQRNRTMTTIMTKIPPFLYIKAKADGNMQSRKCFGIRRIKLASKKMAEVTISLQTDEYDDDSNTIMTETSLFLYIQAKADGNMNSRKRFGIRYIQITN